MLKHWHRMSRLVVDAPSLETSSLNRVLGSLIELKVSLFAAEVWTR